LDPLAERSYFSQALAVRAMGDALDCCADAACPAATATNNCTLADIPTEWEGRAAYWEDFSGPLPVAAKLAEYVQLLYLNGMDWQRLVPGLSEREMANLMRLHEDSMGIADDEWNAQNAGSELLVHLAATLQQAVDGAGAPAIAGLQSAPADALVYYAAHDINIYLLRRLLRLSWLTESYNPNQSPPGGFLMFALYSDAAAQPGAEHHYVKAFFVSQSYRQQREATRLSVADPASRVFAVMPTCASGPELSCPFHLFKKLVRNVVKLNCVQIVDPSFLDACEDE
jgi:hypothetical protein